MNTVIGHSKVETIYLRNNYLTDPFLTSVNQQLVSSKHRIYIDVLEKVRFLEQERIGRSIWVSPLLPHHTAKDLVEFFTDEKKCGLITNV